MSSFLREMLVYLSCFLLLIGSLTASPGASAELIGSAELLRAEQAQIDRQQIVDALDSQALQQRLAALGLEPEQAKARLAALTPAELAQLNAELETLPAGSDLLGIVVLLFVLFVITDAACATDIFSFVHCVNR